jgi:hypothetical protein
MDDLLPLAFSVRPRKTRPLTNRIFLAPSGATRLLQPRSGNYFMQGCGKKAARARGDRGVGQMFPDCCVSATIVAPPQPFLTEF